MSLFTASEGLSDSMEFHRSDRSLEQSRGFWSEGQPSLELGLDGAVQLVICLDVYGTEQH